MESSAVQSQIDNATDLLKAKNAELAGPLDEFVSGCESVAGAYTSLAEAYEKDSEAWATLVNDLLDCMKKTVPLDAVDFKKLTDAIADMKLNVKDEAKANLGVADAKMKAIKDLVDGMTSKISGLVSQKDDACKGRDGPAQRSDLDLASTTENDADTPGFAPIENDPVDATYAAAGGAKKRKLKLKKKLSRKGKNMKPKKK